jgi:DNA-binding FrmR family transcriptional regulator
VGDLQEAVKSEVLRRLKSVEGHIRGVAKMVEDEDATYADVVQHTVLLKDFVEERAEREGASEEMVRDLVKAIDKVVK